VTVSAELNRDLRIRVRNTGAPLGRRTTGLGVGLDNVTRRLEHHYGAGASLSISRDRQGATVAELHIPVGDAETRRVPVITRDARL
jgi:LytS/YehU family sensor histidine kinase